MDAVKITRASPLTSLNRRSLVLPISIASTINIVFNGTAAADPSLSPPTPPLPCNADDAAAPPPLDDLARRGPYAYEVTPLLLHRYLPADLPEEAAKLSATLRVPGGTEQQHGAAAPPPPLPLVVFSPGFMVRSTQYAGWLLDHLASWGFPVAAYDAAPDYYAPDELAAGVLRGVATAGAAALADGGRSGGSSGKGSSGAARQPRRRIYFVGHSRGAKLSVLAAAAAATADRQQQQNASGDTDLDVAALTLIDPVDQAFEGESIPGSVSCLPALRALSARGEGAPPIAIIGAGRGADCAPRASNFAAFARAACGDAAAATGGSGGRSACALVVAQDAGHLQFVEARTTLQQSVCYASPKVDEAAVRAWTAAVATSHGLNAAMWEEGVQTPTPMCLADVAQWWKRVGAVLGLRVV